MSQCHDVYVWDIDEERAHDCAIRCRRQGGRRVVAVEGRLDWHSAHRFREVMRTCEADGEVVIDLRTAETDAAGTGALLTTAARASHLGQKLTIVVDDGWVRSALVATGLGSVFPIVAAPPAASEGPA